MKMTKVTKSLMLDSGAFAVWNRGVDINLKKYIRFCLDHPKTDYFVNLDVIPGLPNKSETKTKSAVEEACQKGWQNYKNLIKEVPKEKVIPVFHQGDDIKWLHKYMEDGAKYIGISPANDRTVYQKKTWLTRGYGLFGESPRKVVLDGAGRQLVKTHGFAVTALSLMHPDVFPWTSVDSATWALSAAMGRIIVPRWIDGKWNYNEEPWEMSVSDTSPHRDKGVHLDNVIKGGEQIENLKRFMSEEKLGPGKWEIENASPNYKLERGKERWFNKDKTKIIRVLSRGFMTNDQVRKYINIRYYQRVGEAFGIDFYVAGLGIRRKTESIIERRLVSFADIVKSDAIYRQVFLFHYNRKINQDMLRASSQLGRAEGRAGSTIAVRR